MESIKKSVVEEFERELHYLIKESKKIGYNPSRLHQMIIRTNDSILMVKKLILSGDVQDGLKILKQKNRLDLSIETLVLKERFKPLFTDEEIKAAQWRLDEIKHM